MEDVVLFTKFLRLVRKYFKREREIDFYARELNVEPRELSRIIAETSDSNLTEWIELMERNRI